jgi:Ca2+-binding EF-hand superfamily protein
MMDADNNGTIDKSEMVKRISALQGILGLRQAMDKGSALRVFNSADTDSSGTLDFNEFCGLIDRLQTIMREEQALPTHQMDASTAHEGLWKVGEPELVRRCTNLLNALDFNKSGVVAGRQLAENLPTVYQMLEQSKEGLTEEQARAAYESDPQAKKIRMVKFDMDSLQELCAHILNGSKHIQERKKKPKDSSQTAKRSAITFTSTVPQVAAAEDLDDELRSWMVEQVSMPKFEREFKKLDTNQDGRLNEDELVELVCWIFGNPEDPRASGQVKRMLQVTNETPAHGLSMKQFRSFYGANSPMNSPKSTSPRNKSEPDPNWPPTNFVKKEFVVAVGKNKSAFTYNEKSGLKDKLRELNTEDGDTHGTINGGLERLYSQPQSYEGVLYQTEMTGWGEDEQYYRIIPRVKEADIVIDADPNGTFTLVHFKADPNGTADWNFESLAQPLSPRAENEKKLWRCFNAMEKDASGTHVLKQTLCSNAANIYKAGGYEKDGLSSRKISQLIQSMTGKDGHCEFFSDDGLDFAGFKEFIGNLRQIATAPETHEKTFVREDGAKITYKTEEAEHMENRLREEANAAHAAHAQAEQAAELAKLTSTPKFQRRFEQLDKDGSGLLDHEEVKELSRWVYATFTKDNKMLDDKQVETEAGKLVRKLDKDGDGQISLNEFKEFFEKKAKQAAKFAATMKKKGVESVDLLNDELVSKEVTLAQYALFERKFKELDVDNDGYLDHEEVKEYCRWINMSFSTQGADDMTPEQLDQETSKLVNRIDANGDGRISIEEFKEHFEARAAKAAKFAANQAKQHKKSVNDMLNNPASPRSLRSQHAPSPRAPSPTGAASATESPRAPSPRASSPRSPKKEMSINDVDWNDPASVAAFEESVKAAARQDKALVS